VESSQIQISALISKATKDLLEKYVRSSGTKKARVIEMALLHHLQALDALPEDVLVPPRLVVSRLSKDALLQKVLHPPKPKPAMRKLMRGDGDT